MPYSSTDQRATCSHSEKRLSKSLSICQTLGHHPSVGPEIHAVNWKQHFRVGFLDSHVSHAVGLCCVMKPNLGYLSVRAREGVERTSRGLGHSRLSGLRPHSATLPPPTPTYVHGTQHRGHLHIVPLVPAPADPQGLPRPTQSRSPVPERHPHRWAGQPPLVPSAHPFGFPLGFDLGLGVGGEEQVAGGICRVRKLGLRALVTLVELVLGSDGGSCPGAL